MPETKVTTEYLASIKAVVDNASWKQAGTTVANIFSKGSVSIIKRQLQKALDEFDRTAAGARLKQAETNLAKWQQKQAMYREDPAVWKQLTKAEQAAFQEEGKQYTQDVQKLKDVAQERAAIEAEYNDSIASLGNNLTLAAGFLTLFGTAVKSAWKSTKDFADRADALSQKFITSSSVKVDTGIRDIMGRFGTSSITAQGIASAENLLGISTQDYAKLTQGQRKAFAELMENYQKGIDSIDTARLKEFTKSVADYQLAIAKFEQDRELVWTKILANSKNLPQLLDTTEKFFDSIANILGSPVVQKGMDIFIGLINGLLNAVTFLPNLIGGGTVNNTTNDSRSVTNNYHIQGGGLNEQQLAEKIAITMKQGW